MLSTRTHTILAAVIIAIGLAMTGPASASAACPPESAHCKGTINPGGWYGASAGPSIGAPNSGAAWAGSVRYGSIGSATKAVEARSMTWIEKLAKRLEVPWPKAGTIRAGDMRTYRVYQIYGPAEKGGSRLFKYGITRVGKSRPSSQLKNCRAAFGVDCTFSWVRNDVKGWTRARKVEAGYASKYKNRFGHCPPGMKKCL